MKARLTYFYQQQSSSIKKYAVGFFKDKQLFVSVFVYTSIDSVVDRVAWALLQILKRKVDM